MVRPEKLIGFPLVTGRFRYRSHRCVLRRQEIAHLRQLARIVDAGNRIEPRDPGWLLPYRDLFRLILESDSPATLALLADRTHSAAMKRLAIWLLGRHSGTLGIKAIAKSSHDEDPLLRREAARALKRKHAWAELRMMQAADSDERVQAIVVQRCPPPYPARLETFLEDVTPERVSGSRTPLSVNIDLDTPPGKPPKPRQLIRSVLDHIRYLVHGRSAWTNNTEEHS